MQTLLYKILVCTKKISHINSTSFSAVATQSFNDVFSASFKNYRVLLRTVGSVDDNTNMRLRVGGADNTTTNFSRQLFRGEASTTTSNRQTGVSIGHLGDSFTEASVFMIDFFHPFETVRTKIISFNFRGGATTTANLFQGIDQSQSLSFDGFTLIANSGTISGSAQIFGYKD